MAPEVSRGYAYSLFKSHLFGHLDQEGSNCAIISLEIDGRYSHLIEIVQEESAASPEDWQADP